MIVEGLAIGELPGKTVGAMKGLGRKVIGAVQGHQEWVAKDTNMGQQAMAFQAFKDLNKHGIEGTRRDRIEQRADLMVTWDLRHVTQSRSISSSL